VLVIIDGDPVWRPVTGTALKRIINTRALVLLDDASGTYYLHLFDGFVEASWLSGPWTVAMAVPNGANQFKDLQDQQACVLVTGRWFRAPGFSGPWHYVAGTNLPLDFAQIPDDSPRLWSCI
jgi:hypothetical protein